MVRKLILIAVMAFIIGFNGFDMRWFHHAQVIPVKTLEVSNTGLTDLSPPAPGLGYEQKFETQIDSLVDPRVNAENPESGLMIPIATIVIDPGHGPWVNLDMEPIAPGSDITKRKYGVGASGITTGTRERDINLNVSLRLRDLLVDAGFEVIMTRTTNDVISSNIDRANLANDHDADLMIRVHSDSFYDSNIHGASVLVPGEVGYAIENVDISRHYGEIILDTMIQEVGMAKRGLYTRTDQTGFNWSKVPIITVEMGFLSNPEEDKLLSTAEYQEKLADALYEGIVKCFKTE